MEELINQVFTVAMSPFTSGSNIVVISVGFSFVLGLVMMVFALIRGRY